MAAPALAGIAHSGRSAIFTINQSGANQGAVTLHLHRKTSSISIQAIGATFDSASIALTVSNDGVNFVAPITTFVALTAAGLRVLPADALGWLYYRFTWSAAGANAVTQLVVAAKE